MAALVSVLSAVDTCVPDCEYAESFRDRLRFRGGVSYFNTRFESHVGGVYGLDGYVPLDGIQHGLGLYGAAKVNQFGGGMQFLGEAGVYKQADPRGCSLLDRIGVAVLFDQFVDRVPATSTCRGWCRVLVISRTAAGRRAFNTGLRWKTIRTSSSSPPAIGSGSCAAGHFPYRERLPLESRL